jgi:hypothetical protein
MAGAKPIQLKVWCKGGRPPISAVLEQLFWIYKRRRNALRQSRDSVDRPLRMGDG